MLSLHPVPELIDYCERLVMYTDFGKNVDYSGDPRGQLTGMICENTIKDALNLPLVSEDSDPDDGWDFTRNTKRIDIKSTTRTVDPKESYACNFIARQLSRTCDYLMFASYNKLTDNVTVCGIISKNDFIAKATYYPVGALRPKSDGTFFTVRRPIYEIAISKLNQLYSWDDLDKEVK